VYPPDLSGNALKKAKVNGSADMEVGHGKEEKNETEGYKSEKEMDARLEAVSNSAVAETNFMKSGDVVEARYVVLFEVRLQFRVTHTLSSTRIQIVGS
jgi:hypothetical protein